MMKLVLLSAVLFTGTQILYADGSATGAQKAEAEKKVTPYGQVYGHYKLYDSQNNIKSNAQLYVGRLGLIAAQGLASADVRARLGAPDKRSFEQGFINLDLGKDSGFSFKIGRFPHAVVDLVGVDSVDTEATYLGIFRADGISLGYLSKDEGDFSYGLSVSVFDSLPNAADRFSAGFSETPHKGVVLGASANYLKTKAKLVLAVENDQLVSHPEKEINCESANPVSQAALTINEPEDNNPLEGCTVDGRNDVSQIADFALSAVSVGSEIGGVEFGGWYGVTSYGEAKEVQTLSSGTTKETVVAAAKTIHRYGFGMKTSFKSLGKTTGFIEEGDDIYFAGHAENKTGDAMVSETKLALELGYELHGLSLMYNLSYTQAEDDIFSEKGSKNMTSQKLENYLAFNYSL